MARTTRAAPSELRIAIQYLVGTKPGGHVFVMMWTGTGPLVHGAFFSISSPGINTVIGDYF